jgi:ABC-type tungstate transport system permease subunit
MATTHITPTTLYPVLHADHGANTEQTVFYAATSLSEALAMAEQADAGTRDTAIAIPAELFAVAMAEGIAFNPADGRLID